MSPRTILISLTLILVFLALGVYLWSPSTNDTVPGLTPIAGRSELPMQSEHGGYTSSEACQECHGDQYASWHDSFHRTMTQVATPKSVVAPFNNIRLRSRGRSYKLHRDGDKFMIRMPDPDFEAVAALNGKDLSKINPPVVEKEIVMTTGSHRMQEFWVGSEEPNLLRQVPWVYLLKEQKWVPREDIFIIPEDAPRQFVTWNNNCIVCHATRGIPNFDAEQMTMQTQVAELGIACESCHGPGEPHIQFHRSRTASATSPAASERQSVANTDHSATQDPIVSPANVNHETASEICAQCHSAFTPRDSNTFAAHGYTYQPGDNLFDDREAITFASSIASSDEKLQWLFWNDGTCRVSGREYSAMKDSACALRGEMTCISCHSMHDSDPVDQLAPSMESNEACTQCHVSIGEQIEQHTHHAADSVGSQCYNCHMPNTTFGLLTAMRNHRIQSPQISGNENTDQPNACNLCHLDQPVSWSASKLSDWYGQGAATLNEEQQTIAAGPLWLLKGDAVQRSLAAWHMKWEPARKAMQADPAPSQWELPLLAELLTDDYAVVRFVAEQSMRALEGMQLPDENQMNDAEYDYVGQWHERRAYQKKWLEHWNTKDVSLSDVDVDRLRKLLIDPATGETDKTSIQVLLDQQDRRPIMLPE